MPFLCGIQYLVTVFEVWPVVMCLRDDVRGSVFVIDPVVWP